MSDLLGSLPISRSDKLGCARRELAERLRPPIILPLRGDLELIIDARDVWIFTFNWWSIRKGRNTHYLCRRSGNQTLHLHREIIGAPRELLVDHKNGNGLDVRRCNLRLATRCQNNWNRRKGIGESGYMGVSFHPLSGLWRARVKSGGNETASYHKTREEAARARDEMATSARGEFASLNFPKDEADREIAIMAAIVADYEGGAGG